jgi:hypothetical protein
MSDGPSSLRNTAATGRLPSGNEAGTGGGKATEAEPGDAALPVAPADEAYDPVQPWDGPSFAGLPWALVPPAPAPTKPPRARRWSGEDVTAMLESDLLAADTELGLRQPETRKLVDVLSTQIRHASLPNGARVTFAFVVSGAGTVTSVTVTSQSAGSSSTSSAVAAATADGLVSTTVRPGAYEHGAIVEIEAIVLMSKPSNSESPVMLEVECDKGGRLAKAKELRDIPDIIPFDPTATSYGFGAIGGPLYEAPPTVDDFAPCYRPGGSFDLSDLGARSTRHVRTRVSVRALPAPVEP